MPYAIRLPNGALVQNIPDDLSQEEAKQRIIAAGLVADQTINQPQAPEGGFFPAIKRGALQTGMLLGDVLPAMVARGFGADEYANRQLKEAAETQARIQREVPAAVPSFTDISSLGDAWMYAKEAVGESLVSIVPSLITGGAAGLVARPAIAAANQAAKEAAERVLMSAAMKAGPPTQVAIEAAKKQAIDAGIKAAQSTALKYEIAGGVVGSAAQNIPEVYQNILEETGKESIPAALIAGGFNAALDSVLPIAILRKLRSEGLSPTEVMGAWYKRGAAGLGKGFLIEGSTEAAQESSSIAAENFVADNPEVFTSKNLERVINAGLKGGLGGGVITGVTDIALGRAPAPEISDRERAEQLQREILGEVETARAEQLLAEQEAVEKARLEALRPPTADEIVDLARAENGYGRLESVKQRLLNQEKTPEVVEALKTIRELQNRIVIEEQQRRAPSIPAEMTDEVIRKTLGFAKSENPKSVYQQLIGKSTSDPDVLAFLRNYADTKAAPQTKLRIEGFLERAGQTPLTAQEIDQGERDAGQAIVAPGGAGVAVAGEPGAGAAAPGVGITQPSGVVPPVEDVEQPDVREGTEQPSVGQIISIPLTDRDAVEQHAVKGYPIIEAPLDQLSISMDVPQFKSDADKKGIVKPLEGKFERIGVAPIQLWRRLDGRLEVISGRHRFDLAQRTGETTIPAQIHDEASGFGAAQAATLDAELNIRDEQGEVKDYVVYFENSGISEADAKARGLLGRTVGQRGWAIASKGSPELVAAHRSGVVPDDAAAGIATLAPNDSRIQAVGLRAVQDNKSTPAVLNTVQAVQALATERGAPREEAGDLFGFDDSAIKEAEEMARIATDRQRSITSRLSAITGAANKPAVAKAEGIDIKDEQALNKRIQELKNARAAWNNWSTNPTLIKEIRDEMQGISPVEPELPAVDTAKPLASLRDAISAAKTSIEEQIKDWSSRVYKANKAQIELTGDGPSRQGSMSISQINESKRRRAVEGLSAELNAVKKLEQQLADPEMVERLFRQARNAYADAERGVREGTARNKDVGLEFESILLDRLNIRPPRGSYTSNNISKAIRKVVETLPAEVQTEQAPPSKPLEGQAAKDAEQAGEDLLATFGTALGKPSLAPSPPPKPVKLSKETETKITELGKVLQRILGKFGLKNVALSIEQDLRVNGEYANRLIKLALDADSPVRDLRHESLHAMKELGFFSDAQWKTLEKFARDKWIDKYLKNRVTTYNGEQMSRYDAYMRLYNGSEDAVIEEAIADAFGDFDITKPPAGLMQTLLRRMRDLFRGIKESMGIANIDTAEDIFRRVEKGELREVTASGSKNITKASLRVMRGEERPDLGKSVTVDKVGKYFDEQIIKEFGGKLDYNNPEHFDRAVKQATEEVQYQIKNDKSGLDWYEEDIQKAFKDTAKVLPDLKSKENRILFSVMAGIMSPQTIARDNWFIAAKAFEHYINTGNIPGINPENGNLWMGGTQAPNKKVQLEFLDKMVKDLGQKNAIKWMMTPHTVKEINEFRSKYGNIKSGIDGKAADIKPGLYAFGPKIGPFVSNINGIHDVTVDKWFTRTFNRYFGTMIGPDGKIVDAPSEPQRRFIKELANKVAENAGIKNYQVQSLLWFYEQRLFTELGAQSPSYGFSDGAVKFLESRGKGGGAGVAVPAGTTGAGRAKPSLRAPQTEAFKRWFGNSKVVDENGDPLVVYHGTDALKDFSVFVEESHFGSTAAANERLENRNEESARVLPVYLSIKNPLRVTDAEASDEATLLNAIKRGSYKGIDINTAVRKGVSRALEDAGYDGLIYENRVEDRGKDSWVAFRPEQIKSAIGNIGTFDAKNPDIRYSLRDSLGLYSELENKIAQGPNKAAAPAWKAYINALPQKGVKPEEIEWSGVRDWLDLQTGPITKDAVNAYLKQGGVRVEETVLSSVVLPEVQTEDISANTDLMTPDGEEATKVTAIFFKPTPRAAAQEWKAYDMDIGVVLYDEYNNFDGAYRSLNEAKQFVQQKAREASTEYDNETKYGQYTLPGGENYREVLLTLPMSKVPSYDEITEFAKRWVQEEFDRRGTRFTDDQEKVDAMKDDIWAWNDLWSEAAIKHFGLKDTGRLRPYGYGSSRTTDAKPADMYESKHWDQPNVLAHIRVNDRTDRDGKRVLFVEEVQSDWGQEGKKRGFGANWEVQETPDGKFQILRNGQAVGGAHATKAIAERLLEQGRGNDNVISAAPFVATRKFAVFKGGKEFTRTDKEGKEVKQRYDSMEAAEAAAKKVDGEARDLGMHANTEGWLNLALKRIMVMAGEGGYDKVAFVNGEQSADRYDLSKHFSEIAYWKESDREYGITVLDMSGSPVQGADAATGDIAWLESTVGRELAQRIVNDEGDATPDVSEFLDRRTGRLTEGVKVIQGEGLKVGGEGMKAFYDTIVPTALKKLLPKVGGGQLMPVQMEIPGATNRIDKPRMETIQQPGFDVTPDMQRKVETTGLPRFSLKDASWSDKRVETLLNKYSYLQNGREKDTKAYAAFVRPEDFLAATTPVIDRERLESEKTPLDVKRLAKEDQEIFLDIKTTEDEGVYQITGHEGRHRIMALRDAGVTSVPVVLYTGGTKNAEIVEEPYFKSQEHRGDKRLIKSQRGFSAMEMIPINWDQRNNIKETFGQPADVRFSLREDLGPRMNLRAQIDPAINARIDQTTFQRPEKGFIKRMMEAISPKNFSSFRASFLNRYNYLSEIDKEKVRLMGGKDLLADASAESAALLSDLGAGLTASAMGVNDRRGGAPVYKRYFVVEVNNRSLAQQYATRAAAQAAAARVNGVVRERGFTTVSTFNDTIKGPVAILAPLLSKYKDPHIFRSFQFYSGVKRGARFMYTTNAQGQVVEKLFDPADIQKAQQLEKQFPEFVQAHKEWIAYNDKLVDFLMDTGVLSKERADIYKMHGDYFPFYRQLDEDADALGPKVFQSIAAVRPPKKLKGGEERLGDFFENFVRNTQSAVQAGVKNIASRRAADVGMDVGVVRPLPQGVKTGGPTQFTVLEDGEIKHYESNDMLFINAIKSLNLPDMPGIGILAGPANLLRNLVTKDPGFILANLMRDSMSAWVTSGVKMTPIADTVANFGKSLFTNNKEFNALLDAGIIGGYEFSQNVETSAKKFGGAIRKAAGVPTMTEQIARPVTSVWNALERATTASDAATRMEIYKKTLAETGNEAEALYRSLEMMNFNRKGSSAVIRILTAAVPFLNARIQGLDLLYRAGINPMLDKSASDRAKEIQKTFFVRGAMIMGLSAAYWALTHDDEDYKKQEQETRDNYWLLPSLGIKIPIPFEIGVIFKVIPERILGYTMGTDTGKDFLDSMKRQLLNTLAFNPIPQAFIPIVETVTDFSFFTWRQILPQGMENVAPQYQVGPGTSKLAEGIGKAIGASPIKIDQLINGYTGTMGMYAVDLMDAIFNTMTDSPKPSKRFEQMPVIRRFAVDPEARGTVTAYYDLKNAVDQVVRTMNLLEKSMDYEGYGEYMQENMKLLAARDYVLDMEKTLKELREAKNTVRVSTMDADAKRDSLTTIGQIENGLTSNIQDLKKIFR